MNDEKLKRAIEHCLTVEAQAIEQAISKVSSQIAEASEEIHSNKGALVVTGVGKSALIGQKIAASFRSIGTRAVFLNAHELFHGDSGFLTNGDILLAISNSGKTKEFSGAIELAKNTKCKVIALVGTSSFPKASEVNLIIEASVDKEAHNGNFLPTASTTLALACGDSLVVGVAELNEFSQDDFSLNHSSGTLGIETSHTVADVMVHKNHAPVVQKTQNIRQVAIELTSKPHGMAIVENEDGSFYGIVTDGDIRRALLDSLDPDVAQMSAIATTDPLKLTPDLSIREAVNILESRTPHPVYSAPVLKNGEILGLVTLHLLVQIGN